MIYKIVRWSGAVLAVLVISELVGLGILRHNISSFANYWRGRANQPGDFIYVALGDSAAQGLGASKPQHGYVGLIADSIQRQTGRTVRVINLSVTGAKLEDALRLQAPKLADYTPDLVTVEIGANNMGTFNKADFSVKYNKFLGTLPPGRSVVSDMPYFGTRPQYNDNAQGANAIIHGQAKAYAIPVANLYGSLQDRQTPFIYASDFFHPNDRGYRIWYDAFWPEVEATLHK